ncbi:MAG TPA: response regulator [Chitinophagaceae bacterium]|nr:response regulator [Chitinophagaceae bacterium]
MSTGNLHIVIVDDDRLQVTALKKIIDDTALAETVSVFGNGQEAADFITNVAAEGERLPDIIFLDINMPVMNAWKFLEAFTKMKRHLYHPIPVYVVTSSTEGLDMAHSRHFDTVKGYITKPVTKERIQQVLAGISAM